MKFLTGLLVLVPLGWSQTCAPRLPLQPADSVSGALDPTDCVLSDGTPYVEYSLVLPTRGTIQLDGASSDFALSLILRDSNYHSLGNGASIGRSLESGSYIVVVNAGAAGQTGTFTLRSSFTPVNVPTL